MECMLRICGAIDERDICTTMPVVGFPWHNLPADLAEMDHKGKPFIELQHGTPAYAVEQGLMTPDQIREYTCFAFLRNPFDRFISAHSHSQTGLLLQVQFRERVLKDLELQLLTRPSVDYFIYEDKLVCEPLQFSDFKNEVNRMIRYIGGHEFDLIPRINSSRGRIKGLDMMEYYDEETEAHTRNRFAEDFLLFDELGVHNG